MQPRTLPIQRPVSWPDLKFSCGGRAKGNAKHGRGEFFHNWAELKNYCVLGELRLIVKCSTIFREIFGQQNCLWKLPVPSIFSLLPKWESYASLHTSQMTLKRVSAACWFGENVKLVVLCSETFLPCCWFRKTDGNERKWLQPYKKMRSHQHLDTASCENPQR